MQLKASIVPRQPLKPAVKQILVKTVRDYILPYQAAGMICGKPLSYGGIFLVMAFMLFALPSADAEDSIGRGPDSDSDGLSDSFERRLGSNPAVTDSDRDGLSDAVEYTGGDSGMPSDPTDRDSDNDGLRDDVELSTGTDPTSRDSDSDGLSDSLELGLHANPLSGDSDWDGVADNIEVWHGSDPSNPDSFFVLPESPVGPILMVTAATAALVGYTHIGKTRVATAK